MEALRYGRGDRYEAHSEAHLEDVMAEVKREAEWRSLLVVVQMANDVLQAKPLKIRT